MYHTLPMSYGELLPILVQNYGISVIPARPRGPLYPKGYDINARCEYHGEDRGHFIKKLHNFQGQGPIPIDADPTKLRELVNGHQKH